MGEALISKRSVGAFVWETMGYLMGTVAGFDRRYRGDRG